MNKGGMRYFKRAKRPAGKATNVLSCRNLNEEQLLQVVSSLNGLAEPIPLPKDMLGPECQGEACWEIPGDIKRAEFKWKNTRPMLQIDEFTFVSAADVALYIQLGRHKAGGMTVSHLCGNPKCVNPKHMAEMTQAENKKYGMKFEMEIKELKLMGSKQLGPAISVADSVLMRLGYGASGGKPRG